MIFKDLGLLVDILKVEKYSCNRYLDKIYREFYLFITVPIWTHFLMIYVTNGTPWCTKISLYEIKIFGLKIYYQICYTTKSQKLRQSKIICFPHGITRGVTILVVGHKVTMWQCLITKTVINHFNLWSFLFSLTSWNFRKFLRLISYF